MNTIRFKYNEIGRGERLWVCLIHTHDGHRSEYNFPAIVLETNHREVVVKYGNVQPFSTQWAFSGDFDQGHYQKNANAYPLTSLSTKEITFEVRGDIVQKNKRMTPKNRVVVAELQSHPVRLYRQNPYHRVLSPNFPTRDYAPDPQSFIKAIWEIECERDIPRFTLPSLEWFVTNHFIVEWADPRVLVKTSELHAYPFIIRTEIDNAFYIDTPSSRKNLVEVFFQKCVPHLSNYAWFAMIRKFGLNNMRYSRILQSIHRAYLVTQEQAEVVESLSFTVTPEELKDLETATSQLGLEVWSYKDPVSMYSIVQIQTQAITEMVAQFYVV